MTEERARERRPQHAPSMSDQKLRLEPFRDDRGNFGVTVLSPDFDPRTMARLIRKQRAKREAEPVRRAAKKRMMASMLARKEAALRKNKARL